MPPRATAAGAAALAMLLGGVACQSAEAPNPPGSLGSGGPAIVLADANSPDRLWVIQPTTRSTGGLPDDTVAYGAALWADSAGLPIVSSLPLQLRLRTDVDGLGWSLVQGDRWRGAGRGDLAMDPGQSAPRARGEAAFSWDGAPSLLTFDAVYGMPLPLEPIIRDPRPEAIVSTPGVVTLRMDDCPAQDSIAFRILHELHLVAEVAVPTALVGHLHYCTWNLVHAMADDGNAIEAHSRTHAGPPATIADFYMETVGAYDDLRAQGFDPAIFIQPGTWATGPGDFDGPAKFNSAYGALLRWVYAGVEAYAYPDGPIPFPPTGGRGPEHIPMHAFTPEGLGRYLHNQAVGHQWVHLAWHSYTISPSALRARLEVVAALRDSGLITVMPYRMALRGARPPGWTDAAGSPTPRP